MVNFYKAYVDINKRVMLRNKIQWYLLFLIFSCISDPLIAQIFFPTQADHDRKVDSMLSILKIAKEDTVKVNTLNNLSQELSDWSTEGKPKAINYAEEALALSEKINYQKGKAKSCFRIARVLNSQGKNEQALSYYLRSLEISESEKDYIGMSNCYSGIGWLYCTLKKDTVKALESFNSCLEIAFRSGDKYTIIGAYETFAFFFSGKKPPSYHESLRYYLMMLKITEEMGDKEGIFVALGQIGALYLRLEDYAEAYKYFSMVKQKTGENTLLVNLLTCLRGLKNFTEAINVLNDYIDKQKNNKRLVSVGLSQLGLIYKEKAEELSRKNGNIDTILFCLDRAFENFEASKKIQKQENIKAIYSNIKFDYGIIYKTKAEILQKKGIPQAQLVNDLNIALEFFLAQLKDTSYPRYNQIKADCYVKAGDILFMRSNLLSGKDVSKKYDEALKYLDSGIMIGKIVSDKEAMKDAYWSKAQIYKEIKNYDKSLEALKFYDSTKDSIKIDETNKKVEQFNAIKEVILGVTEEKARYEGTINDLNYRYAKEGDSLKFQKALAEEQFKQKQKEIELKNAELKLMDNQNKMSVLAFEKSQAELENEQGQRREKEKQLTIAERERDLQNSELNLQKSQLNLKENQIQSEKRQRYFYGGGLLLMLLVFVLVYRNFKNKQKTKDLIAAEKLKTEKASAAHTMAELELQSLRAQLNPHFMFNSLNAIQELILKEDNDNSHLYLSRFSELLRMLLDNANQPFVSLRKEINLLELYLSLENLRIPDLKYAIEIDPAIDSNRITIPNMMLQPYIENAIWHGLSHKKGERNLKIRISKNEDSIVCEVEDNGVGRKLSAELKSLYRKEHRSRGMELLSKRFNLLSKEYGSEIQTTVEDLHDNGTATGTRVAITVPYSLTEQAPIIYS